PVLRFGNARHLPTIALNAGLGQSTIIGPVLLSVANDRAIGTERPFPWLIERECEAFVIRRLQTQLRSGLHIDQITVDKQLPAVTELNDALGRRARSKWARHGDTE